jgi:Uma2 family endonuclease
MTEGVMAIEQQRLYTVEEFETIAETPQNRDRLLELVNGEIIEKVPTQEHGLYAGNIFGPLWNYAQAHGGRVVMEVRYRSPKDRHNARIPDVSYTVGDEELVTKGSVPHMPALAVEIKSPDDALKKMREKARYYVENGTQLVWLVIPERHIVEVYTPDDEQILDENDALDGLTVLPGFSLPVREVFKDTGKQRL